MITLTILGKPRAWQRARLAKGGRHHFTDDKTRRMKATVVWAFRLWVFKGIGTNEPWTGPIRLWVKAYFPIPVNTPKALRAKMETETVWYPHKSDWDNIGKLPSDALNGIAYIDDCLGVDGRVRNCYSPRSRVESELEDLT